MVRRPSATNCSSQSKYCKRESNARGTVISRNAATAPNPRRTTTATTGPVSTTDRAIPGLDPTAAWPVQDRDPAANGPVSTAVGTVC